MAQTKSEVADSIWSSVRKTVRPGVVDNFFEDYPTVGEFRKSALKEEDRGSREIQVTLQSSGGTAESFDRYDSLNKNPIDPFEAAFFRRRYYAVPVILSDTENWENMGPERVFDLFKSLGDNAMDSLVKAINEDMYTAQAGKNMLGFPDIIATSANTVGGIDASSNSWWDNQRDTTATTFLTQTTTNVFDGFTRWDSILDTMRIQGARPSHGFTTWSIAKAYRTALASQGYARTELSNASGVGGKHAPDFYGVKIIPDNDCTALHTYFIDQRHIKLATLRQASFKKTPFVSLQSNGQLAQLCYVVASVQLTTNNRRRLGVGTAITGS